MNEVVEGDLVKQVTLLGFLCQPTTTSSNDTHEDIIRLTLLHSRLSGVPIWPAAPMRAILVIFEVDL